MAHGSWQASSVQNHSCTEGVFQFLILHDGMCQLAANVSRSERLLPSVGYQ